MITFPNAKINIGLQILRKRSDGFHDIASCFYPIACQDVLEILPLQGAETHFQASGIPIPLDKNANICLRAYYLLQKDFDLSPVFIHLHKNIPIGAGLGGGSADAAYTLKMLNILFNLGLDTISLQKYASKLGSDCAFFIQNIPQFCTEKGDIFEDIDLNLKGKYLYLVYPNLHISTQEAYSKVTPQPANISLKRILAQPLHTWKEQVENDFEKSLFKTYPILSAIKAQLYEAGATYSSMTGSGSTIFGIFETPPPTAFTLFSKHYWTWQGIL